MTIEQFKGVLHAQPFRPFTIHMKDGRTFRIKHQDFISRSESGKTVVVHGPEESISVFDLVMMGEIKVDQPGHAAE